jgi:hypothetical protein
MFFLLGSLCAQRGDEDLEQSYNMTEADSDESKLVKVLLKVSRPGPSQAQDLTKLQETLNVSFATLPRNKQGRLGLRATRYILHRHFSGTNGMLMHGIEHHGFLLEPPKALHEVSIIRNKAPFLKKLLLAARPWENGLSNEEVVALANVVKELVFDESAAYITQAYELRKRSPEDVLTNEEMLKLLEAFLMMFSRGDPNLDKKTYERFYSSMSERKNSSMRGFAINAMQAVQYHTEPNPFRVDHYSYDKVLKIIAWITERYGKHQNKDCLDMKTTLIKLDPFQEGRVPLKAFYSERHRGALWFQD